MKKLILALVCFLSINIYAQNNNEDKLPKGEVYKSPLIDVAKRYTTLKTIVGEDSKKWQLKGKNLLSTGRYKSNATYRKQSLSIKLPVLKNKNERINLHVKEQFELESYHDEGQILVSKDKGSTWETVSIRSGKRSLGTTVVNLSKFAGKKIRIAFELKTDKSNNYGGWIVKSAALKYEVVGGIKRTGKRAKSAISSQSFVKSASATNLSGNFSGLDDAGFNKEISLHCVISNNNGALLSLDEDNFTVWETVDSIWTYDPNWAEGKILRDYRNKSNSPKFFVVETPSNTQTEKIADIVFLIDNSGSMGSYQAAVNANVNKFLDSLNTSGIDANIGFVRFGQSINNGDPIVETNGLGTSWWSNYQGDTALYGIEAFRTAWQDRNKTTGSIEPSYDALLAAASPEYSFNQGAQRIAILITDESITNNNEKYSNVFTDQGSVIQRMLAQDFKVYSISRVGHADCEADFRPISDATGGDYYNLNDDFSNILDSISTNIANVYEITYTPVRDHFDGLKREVEIQVVHNSDTLLLNGKSYVPGSAPKVELTQHTLDTLHFSQPWSDKTPAIIEAWVYDYVAPRVQDGLNGSYINLVYKNVATSVWKETPMTLLSTLANGDTSKWQATIPGTDIETPGMEYYIKVSDGETSGTTPINPIQYAWSFAVMPNVAPSLADSTLYVNISDRDETVMTKTGYYTGDVITYRLRAVDSTMNLTDVKIYTKKFGENFEPHSMASVGNNIYTYTHILTKGINQYYFKATDSYGISQWLGTETDPYEIDGEMVPCYDKHELFFSERRPPRRVHTEFFGEALSANDKIGFYFKDDQGIEREYDSKGLLELGKSIVLHCNDVNTAGKDGYETGDEIRVKIWRDSEQRWFDAYVAVNKSSTSTAYTGLNFTDAGKTFMDTIAVFGQRSIIERVGVSPEFWWSSYVDFSDYSFDAIFSDYITDIEWVEDNEGNRWTPGGSSNTLSTYTPGYGYNIRLKSGVDFIHFEALGLQRKYSQESVNMNLWSDGGSLLGCPYTKGENITNIIGTNDVDGVYKKVGNSMYAYIPSDPSWSDWTTDLNIYPGNAYLFESAISTYSFTFPAPTGTLNSVKSKSLSVANSNVKTMPQNIREEKEFMPLLIPDRAWTTPPTNGDIIKVYSKLGDLIGQNYIYNKGSLLLIDGLELAKGEAFDIHYVDVSSKEERLLSIEKWEKGSGFYQAHQLTIAGKVSSLSNSIDNSEVFDMTIFPNPVVNEIRMDVLSPSTFLGTINIVNLIGTTVLSKQIELTEGRQQVNIPIELPKGIYILNINDGRTNQISKKVIVQ